MDYQRKDNSDPEKKRNAPDDYRPIKRLPTMCKILTAQIKEEIYYSLISQGLFPEEKICHKRTRRTSELLYIDQHILMEC